MEPVTHFLTGACLARAGFNRKAAYATLAMTLAAEAPDLDTLWGFGGPVAGFEHHRSITHTLLGLPFEGVAVVGAVWLLHRWRVRRAANETHAARGAAVAQTSEATDVHVTRPLTAAPVRWGLLYGFVLIALLSHLLLDWTNNYGLRPFFPFDAQWYAGSFVFIFEPVLFAALLAGLVAPALFGLIAGEVGARKPAFRGRAWAIFALSAVVVLWGVRWFEHDAAVDLASNASYGPVSAPAGAGDSGASSSARAAASASGEILRVTADPYPGNPFEWQTVVETPAFCEVAIVDTLKGTVTTDPGRDLFYKPAATAATRAARRSWLGEVYLDWSSWPVVADTGPTAALDSAPGTPDWRVVSFRDLRFFYDTARLRGRSDPPLSGMVYVDAQGNVVRMEIGDHVQR